MAGEFNPADFLHAPSRRLSTGCLHETDEQREELTFTPELVYFPYLLEGQTSDPLPFTVTNSGNIPVGVQGISVTGDFEIVGDLPEQLAVGEMVELQILFKPTGSGARIGDVIINAGVAGPQECVHLIGIGGQDVFAVDIEALQAQINAAVATNAAQTQQINALQGIINGLVPEGNPIYMWRAYSNSPDGHSNFTTGSPDNHSFIGLAFNMSSPVPSEDPDDYEWSALGYAISNVISDDTVNVAGRPAVQLITDFDDLALQLLAYQFDRQELRDYVDALLYVDGEGVNSALINLKTQIENDQEAAAETLDIMGARSGDGLSFIMDMAKVYAGPTITFAQKLSNMVAETDDAKASVQDLQEAITAENYAKAVDLSLLGAKTPDGTAWQMDMSTVLVSPTETLSQYINSSVAAAAGNAASVTELHEALIDPVNGASAKALLQLDVNGNIVGYAATNDGTFGQIKFSFDSFIIKHPVNGDPLFIAEGGVVKMPNVEIEKLKVGSVISEAILPGAVTQKIFWSVSMGGANGKTLGNLNEKTWAAFGPVGNKASITTPVVPATTEVNIRTYVNMKRTGSDNDRVWFRLKRTNVTTNEVAYVGDTVQSGMGNYPMMFTYEWTDYPPTSDPYTYALEYYRDIGEGSYLNIKLIADLGKR